MPKEKPFKANFKAFYKAQAEDIAMFGFIYGVQHFLPAIQTKTLIESFKQCFNLEDDDYPSDCAASNFTVIQNKFFGLHKSEEKK